MRMPEFIESRLEPILREWDEFAGRQQPAGEGLSAEERRNLAAEILRAVAEDMRTRQSEAERHDKSRGGRPVEPPEDVTTSARGHAAERLSQGFTLNQLVAEYRALRASIVRRWRAETDNARHDALEELTRFHEAMDESLTVAISWYHVKLEDARDLLNGVLAHDLRSPLGAILNSADLLLLDDGLGAQHTSTAVRIRHSAARMRSMITDLLDFTRTRLGSGLPLAIGEYDMGSIVRVVCEEQRALHPEATLHCETSGDLAGEWDHERIEQMLANIIGNAATHGEQSPISVIVDGRADVIAIVVHNERGVIGEQEQRLLFDPVRRAAIEPGGDRSVAAHLGLGLYIARSIAEAHAGGIEVNSSNEDGTRVTIRLPRRHVAGAEKAGLT